MIKEFKFKNFRSFKDEQILSLEPLNRKEDELDYFNIAKIKKEAILKTAVIFGHNSYGKSNIFKALDEMIKIVKYSTNQDYKIEVDNFKLDLESQKSVSLFEITFIIDEITYRYGFEVLKTKIVKEWLYKKNVREVNIFKRTSAKNSSIELNTSYEKLKKFIEFTREEELFLSSMVRNNEKNEMKKIYDWLTTNIKVISAERIFPRITSDLLLKNSLTKKAILNALQNADLGIEDIEIVEEEIFLEIPLIIKKDSAGKDIVSKKSFRTEEKVKHSIFDKNKNKVGDIEFEFENKESEGTRKFYSVLGPILEALENGYSLFIDELDSKMQHKLITYIVNLFHNLSANRKNAQLVFNTHDFYLLKEEIFRRDQIYFTDKNTYGESSLYSLGDFKGLDKKSNIMAHYLAGNFGAVGKIEQGD